MKVNLSLVVLAAVLSSTSVPAFAMPTAAGDVAHTEKALLSLADAHEMWTRGKVVRVSTARGKVTIEHGPIANLEMMAMTMPFSVSDPSLLEGLEAGDEIEFVADMKDGGLILTNVRRPAG